MITIIMVIELSLSQNVTISGLVKNPLDKPVKKANVTLRNLKEEIIQEAVTNRKGVFELEGIDPKFYYLVIEHEADGSKRIKINPRKKQNEDLNLLFYLDGIEDSVECYLFGSEPPTSFDPVLNINNVQIETAPEKIIVTWKDKKQAKLYELFENGEKVYVGEETRYEKEVYPGTEYCYEIQASGDYGLKGLFSSKSCTSATTQSPKNIKIDAYKNSLSLSWSPVEGAVSYAVYRDDEMIKELNGISFKEENLDFSTEYFYKVTALDGMQSESKPSIEVKSTTHDFVEVPILSSIESKASITLIWNEVEMAKQYEITRDGAIIDSTSSTTYVDQMPPGKKYCYQVSSIDQYGIETDHSIEHCAKVALPPPSGLQADAGVSSMNLYWDEVMGAESYLIYEKKDQDAFTYVGESRSTQFTVKSLDFSADLCFVVTSIDMDGEESDFSMSGCNIVLDPPHFQVKSMRLNEPSGNDLIDAKEEGSIQFALLNDGQSPAHDVFVSVEPKEPNMFLIIKEPMIIDTLPAGRIKFVDIGIQGMLQVETGEDEFELKLSSREKIELDEPYFFTIETKSMIPPKMIVADFAVSNEFGTHYIPKNEIVSLTIRIQNVGEGDTESVSVDLKDNRTYDTPEFNGKITLPAFAPGDYMDIQVPVMTKSDNFSIELDIIDYLGRLSEQRIDLETMRNYRSPMELTIQDVGAEDVVYYPDALGEVDVDRRIPLGRKNPNGLAVIIGIENYEDNYYPNLKYASRDRDIMRKYFSQSFGLSDFQMLPSKPWQMEGGPSGDELQIIFDPFQGDLRKRVNSAEKYSDMENIEIFVYIRGYGEWVNGKPLIIPRDAKHDRDITKYPIEDMLKNISTLSVIESIEYITIFFDITYLNPEKSSGSLWDYPDLPNKISIISSNSNGESSQIFEDKKHSFFTYGLLKGLSGNADDGNKVIDLGEITEYVYRTLPENLRTQPGLVAQNPKFNGSDLKRIILDLRIGE